MHIACYGIENIFANFICTFCLHKKKNEVNSCVLCPHQNGALVLTEDKSFVHVTCVLYVDKANFSDVKKMTANISSVSNGGRYTDKQ